MSASADRGSLAERIARNSLWYAFEQLFSFLAGFVASVAMARVIGPTRLGYFSYVVWMFNLGAILGTLGIPAATRKYMAEMLGRGEKGLARAVFFYSLRRQAIMGLVVASLCWTVAWFTVDPDFRLITMLLIASIPPNFILAVPSQANVAAEKYAANVPASVIAQVIYVIGVFWSLTTGWELLGIAIGILIYRWVEMLVRLIPVLGWIREFPEQPMPAELLGRIRKFANQGTLVLALNIIVWNRSDIVFLKWLSKDLAQITFYSLGFNLTEKILLMGRSFGSASGASMMVESGRNQERAFSLTARTALYLYLMMAPLLIGLAVMSPVLVPIMYGQQYIPAIVPVALVSALALLSAIHLPPLQLLQATERQKRIIVWTAIGAVVNIGVDILLVPKIGAIGAAIGNGLGQIVAAGGIWFEALRLYPLPMPWAGIGKVSVAVTGMALAAGACVQQLSPLVALFVGPVVGGLVYALMLRLTHALDPSDTQRLRQILPKKAAPLLQLLAPAPTTPVATR